MPDIDLESLKLEVMEALGRTLDEALSRQMGERMEGGGGEEFGEMAPEPPGEEGAEMGMEANPGALEGMGEPLPEDAGAPLVPIEEEEPPQQARVGWRPWMTRPPGS